MRRVATLTPISAVARTRAVAPLSARACPWSAVSRRGARSGTLVVAMLATMLAAGVGGCASTPPEQYFRQERVLTDEMIAKVRPDMTREQVRQLLGTPARIGQDRVTRQEEWMWRYTRLHFRRMCFYTRFHDTGHVAGTASAIETQGADFFKPC